MKLSNNMQLTGNKQEWSKIYALFSILSNPLIHEGDASGKADRKKKLTLIRLKRYTYEGILSFSYSYELKQNSESFFTEDSDRKSVV